MQAISFPSFNKYKKQPVKFIQPKYDGHLVQVYKGLPEYFALTKNDIDITVKFFELNCIEKQIEGVPDGTYLYGELHCPGRPATDVKTMLNARDKALQFNVFAAPMIGGKDFSRVYLPEVMSRLSHFGLQSTPTIILPSTTITNEEQTRLLALAVEDNLEGYVLKREHMAGWYKLKPVDDIDAFVTNVKTSTSVSYWGQLKSVRAGVWKINKDGSRTVYDLGDVPGFKKTVIQAYDTPEKRATLIGRILKIEYSGRAAKGKLKWPHFAGWRTDKDKDACTTDQFK